MKLSVMVSGEIHLTLLIDNTQMISCRLAVQLPNIKHCVSASVRQNKFGGELNEELQKLW